MRNKTKVSAAFLSTAIFGLAISASPAFALTPPAMEIAVGGNSVTIDSTGTQTYTGTCLTSPGSCTGIVTVTTPGVIIWNGSIAGFTVIATGTSKPVLTAPQIDLAVNSITTANGGAITLEFTDAGFKVGESPATMNIIPNTTGTETYASYVDNTNAAFGQGTLVGSTSSLTPVIGPGPTASPFSMTNIETLVLPAGVGTTPFNYPSVNTDFGLATAPYPPLTLTCGTGTGTTNKAYYGSLKASGGDKPYLYSLSGQPAGMTINSSTGLITWTPTSAATYTFTGQVVDSSGTADNTVTASCTIVVGTPTGGGGQNPPPTPLKVVCPPSTATVGVSWDYQVVATGGTPPYTFKIVAGSLPTGLVMSTTGLITGSPTTPGQTGAFKIEVIDSASPPDIAYSNCSGSCSNGTTVSYGGSEPQNGWGQKGSSSTYSSNGLPLTVYGWGTNGKPANLYSNNVGGNTYLGISGNGNQNQIGTGNFVQCDFSSHINAGATGGSFNVSSLDWNAEFNIYGSNTLGQLGTLLAGNVKVNSWSQSSGSSQSIPNFGKYRYISIKPCSGDVVVTNISCNYPCECAIDVGSSGNNQGGNGYGYGYGNQGGNGYGNQGGNQGGQCKQGQSPGQCGW